MGSLHFKSKRGWINDPNGLIVVDDTFHLFFQHHPDSNEWGPMHWGHATTTNLIDWTEQPIAMFPDRRGDIFSGCIIADADNRLGYSRNGNVALLAFFTHHDRAARERGEKIIESQSVAFSFDGGITWVKSRKNPVVANPGNLKDFRDPFVFWHSESHAWIMLLSAGSCLQIYRSKSLWDWELSSEFEADGVEKNAVYECPVLCRIPLEGSDEFRWVLIQSFNPGGRCGSSGTKYFVGSFDGFSFSECETFSALRRIQDSAWLDWGPDHYATNVWGEGSPNDGRPIAISWMSNWAYANQTQEIGFRGSMTTPRAMSLVHRDGRHFIKSTPAADLSRFKIKPEKSEVKFPSGKPFDCVVSHIFDLTAHSDTLIAIKSCGNTVVRIGFDSATESWAVDRSGSNPSLGHDIEDGVFTFPRLLKSQTSQIELVVSESSLELFFDNGLQVATFLLDPHNAAEELRFNNVIHEDHYAESK